MFKNWSESQYMGYLANDGRGVFMLKDDNSGFKTSTEDQKDDTSSSQRSHGSLKPLRLKLLARRTSQPPRTDN